MSDFTQIDERFEESRPSNTIKDEIFDWVSNITFILSAIVLIFIFAIRVVGVDGESMMPTLHHKDWLITSNLFFEPDNGDIVVLSKDSFLDGKMIVKRIIATEGQEIDIDFQKGIVYVDGKVLEEQYIAEPTVTQYTMKFPATVPKDHVFVMGDNRNHSADSRDASLGMVHKSCILGRVVLRILPISDFGAVN